MQKSLPGAALRQPCDASSSSILSHILVSYRPLAAISRGDVGAKDSGWWCECLAAVASHPTGSERNDPPTPSPRRSTLSYDRPQLRRRISRKVVVG